MGGFGEASLREAKGSVGQLREVRAGPAWSGARGFDVAQKGIKLTGGK